MLKTFVERAIQKFKLIYFLSSLQSAFNSIIHQFIFIQIDLIILLNQVITLTDHSYLCLSESSQAQLSLPVYGQLAWPSIHAYTLRKKYNTKKCDHLIITCCTSTVRVNVHQSLRCNLLIQLKSMNLFLFSFFKTFQN